MKKLSHKYKLHGLRCRVYKKSERVCVYCNKKLSKKTFTIDHVIPISLGGNLFHEPNIVICCKECNEEKGNLMLLEFLCNKNNKQKIHRSFEHRFPVIKGKEKNYQLQKESYVITYDVIEDNNIGKKEVEVLLTAGRIKAKNHKVAVQQLKSSLNEKIKE
jgi:hypothetical protein